MKVEELPNKIIVYLIDYNRYDKEGNIKLLIESVFNDLIHYYNIDFYSSYYLNLYINKYYGMILEIEKNEEYMGKDNIVNLKLNIIRDSLFLYEVDDPLNFLDYEIYYYEDKFYVNVKKIDLNLIENSSLIYGDASYKVIGRGIKI